VIVAFSAFLPIYQRLDVASDWYSLLQKNTFSQEQSLSRNTLKVNTLTVAGEKSSGLQARRACSSTSSAKTYAFIVARPRMLHNNEPRDHP
jgi:hypothetical protein